MTAAVFMVLFGTFLHFLPALTRPALFFGVTVDPAFRSSPAAAAIVRRYRLMIWSFTLAAWAIMTVTKRPEAVLLWVGGYFWTIGIAHRHTAEFSASAADSAVEVNLVAPRESFPGGFFGLLLPIAGYVTLAVWLAHNWNQLPARFAIPSGVRGVSRWIPRTPAALFALLGQNVFASLVFLAVGFGILHRSRRNSCRSSIAAEERRFRRTNVQAYLFIACYPAVQAWIIVLQPASIGTWMIAAAVLMLVFYYLLLIPNRPRLSERSGDQTPDGCWKLGIFYFNPADPAVFVVQRFGVGYTFNFGNRWTWAGLATIAAAISVRTVLH